MLGILRIKNMSVDVLKLNEEFLSDNTIEI